MGAMLMTGLACLGAELSHALLVSRTSTRANDAVRRFTIIALAFGQGIAVLGVVVGLLAVFAGRVQDPATTSLLAAGPAALGGLVALAVILRDRAQRDPRLVAIGTGFVAGLALLGTVVGALAVLVVDVASRPVADWPFLVLGPISGLAAVSVGWLARDRVDRIAAAPDGLANAAVTASLTPLFAMQLLGVASAVVAVVILEAAT